MTTFCGANRIRENDDSVKIEVAGINTTLERSYTITADNESNALALLLALPSTAIVDGIPLNGTPKYSFQGVDRTAGKYVGSVAYMHAGRDEQNTGELVNVGDEKISFDFSGEIVQATTAIAQTKYGPNAREVGLAVNVQPNGDVEGFEIGIPIGDFSVEVLLAEATVTNSWLNARKAQMWTLNDDTFRGLPEGDCRVVGMSGEQRSDGTWPVRYTFQARENETVTEIGGVPLGGGVNVAGFQYAWTMFDKKNDDTADDEIVPEPIGSYVADLQRKTDFSLFGVTV